MINFVAWLLLLPVWFRDKWNAAIHSRRFWWHLLTCRRKWCRVRGYVAGMIRCQSRITWASVRNDAADAHGATIGMALEPALDLLFDRPRNPLRFKCPHNKWGCGTGYILLSCKHVARGLAMARLDVSPRQLDVIKMLQTVSAEELPPGEDRWVGTGPDGLPALFKTQAEAAASLRANAQPDLPDLTRRR